MFRRFVAQVFPVLLGLLCLTATGAMAGDTQPPADRWWSENADRAIGAAGANGQQLRAALVGVPASQREGMQFLVENMPDADRKALSATFLREHVALAYQALESAPWKERVPRDLFLNDILPYACLNEKRDGSFAALREKSLPLIADCRTPSQAAQRLNEKLFGLVKVRYSTERRRPDQSPLESMESGLASCSGLSILLVDACRSVGIPARVVGTPLWANLRGNHTWVEIWDGDWHFTGAAEPDAKGLNHGWFTHDAAQARKDAPRHAIYASSFRNTGLSFPLVWAPDLDWVPAVNVTDRYTPKASAAQSDRTRLLVKVLGPNGKRVAAAVTVRSAASGEAALTGTSKDESADLNDFLAFSLPHRSALLVEARDGKRVAAGTFDSGTQSEALLVLELAERNPPASPSTSRATTLKPDVAARLKNALAEYFAASPDRRKTWRFTAESERLLRENEAAVRQSAWDAYRAAPLHAAMRQDFDAKQVRFEKHLSPYTVKTVGTRPAGGWPLFIAMHGGGGVPKEVNDSQWQGMQQHYRDHPELGGYLYLALRAPNDTWNGFYDDYVYPLVSNLIRQFLLFGDVDPDKVYIMGYSHGGYGAYAIGPKMPDRFAAIHASAAAPTDGETSARTLRTTRFTAMVGEKDTMYGRLDRNRKFSEEVRALRGDRSDIYPVDVSVMAGFEHGNLQDRDKIVDMYPAVRNPVPREVTWLMTDSVITDLFWLRTTSPGKTREIDATCRDNRIAVKTSTNVSNASVLLDSRLVDFRKPVTLEVNGKTSQHTLTPSLKTLCDTLLRRGDPELAFTAELSLPLLKEANISETSSTSSAPLKVMTFNLRFAGKTPPNSWAQRRPVMSECLRLTAPDLIGTQEGLYEQLRDIAADRSEYSWIGLGRDGGSRGEFMAVFYRTDRLEPLEFDHFWLSDTPDKIGSKSWGNRVVRMATWVRFRDRRTQQEFLFWNTHLDHESQEAREKGASLILERVKAQSSSLPTLLVGDFNADARQNRAYSILTGDDAFVDTWYAAAERKGKDYATFHGYRAPVENGPHIDWILSRGAVAAESSEVVTFQQNGQYPSDHFPVMATLRLVEPKR